MKLGAYLSGDPRTAKAEADVLAAAGASAWMGEVTGTGWADPFACLTLAAAAGVPLGTALNPMGLRHPAMLAQQAGTLDLLAPGKVTIGFGGGGLTRRILGLSPVRVAALREEVSTLAALLGGEQEGEEPYAVLPLAGAPGRQSIDLLVAAGGERTAAVGGELADGILLAGEFDPDRVASLVDAAAEARRVAGRSGTGRVVLECGPVCLLEPGEALGSERVVAMVQPVITGYFLYFAAHGLGPDDVDPGIRDSYTRFFDEARRKHGDDPGAQRMGLVRDGFGARRADHDRLITEELVDAMTFTGTPEDIEKRLGELAQAGVSEIAVLRSVDRPWHDQQAFQELMTLAGLVRGVPSPPTLKELP